MNFWNVFDDFVEYQRKTVKDVKDYNKSLRKNLSATEKKWENLLLLTP